MLFSKPIGYTCYSEGRRILSKNTNPGRLQFPTKKSKYTKETKSKFANESVKRSRQGENQLANKLKHNNSKGGSRDRSRDFVSVKKRDPSIKFPQSTRFPQHLARNKVGL